MLDLHQCIFDSLFLLWDLDRSFLDSLFLLWDLDRCHFDPLLLLLGGLSPLPVLICFPIGGTGDGLGDLEKLSSFDKSDKSDDMFLDRSRDLQGPLLLLSDGLSSLHVLFFLEGGREMDFEISRNFPVMMNPVKSLSINSGTYWVFCCYYWIVYLYFTFYTGDESTVMSLYGSRDFILFLSLFDICGGVGNTRLSKNIARIYLFLYFFIS